MDTVRKIWHYRRFDSTNVQKETGEATAHTAPGFGTEWTSSFTYIPNLLNSIGPIEFNRAVGLKIEDALGKFSEASSTFNPTAVLNSIGPVEFKNFGMYVKLLVHSVPNPGAVCAVASPVSC